MDIVVSFPGGRRVDASVGSFVVHTDEPVEPGDAASAIAPFDLFLASIATCAGSSVLAFCQARSIPMDGISLVESVESFADTRLPRVVHLVLRLPSSFPEKYREAIARTVAGCRVNKAMATRPRIEVTLCIGHAENAA